MSFNTLAESIEAFAQTPYDQRARAKLIQGHVHYGIHREIPQEASYITILRDPFARVLSLYGYILREPRHPLHAQVTASGMDLERFIVSRIDKNQIENGQTRQIAGVQERDPTREDLEAAERNLRGFLAVGLTERFDESLILMKRKLDWRTPFYVSRNVAPPKGKRLISDQATDLIREKNQLDLALYSEASKILEEQVSELGDLFELEVAHFQRLNRFYDAFGNRANALVDQIKYSRPFRHLRGAGS